jgi:4,5-dihydroxyphthalate decarboxylase
MADVEIAFPWLRYDTLLPLMEGRVEIPGVRLRLAPGPQGSTIPDDSPLPAGDFDLVDLNLANLLPAIEAGWELIALPVFTKRKSVLNYVFVRSDAGIQNPKDLEGKRIGAGRYLSLVGLWLRGLLRDQYDVDVASFRWLVTGDDRFPVAAPLGSVARSTTDNVLDAFFAGEVDAIMMDVADADAFARLESSPDVRRLFPEYAVEDLRVFRATGIYTPHHVLAMSKRLARQHPELAGTLYRALERSKQLATRDLLSDTGPLPILYLREHVQEQIARWGDPRPYGITANRRTIDAFVRYNVEQGMIRSPLSYEQVFAASTLDT